MERNDGLFLEPLQLLAPPEAVSPSDVLLMSISTMPLLSWITSPLLSQMPPVPQEAWKEYHETRPIRFQYEALQERLNALHEQYIAFTTPKTSKILWTDRWEYGLDEKVADCLQKLVQIQTVEKNIIFRLETCSDPFKTIWQESIQQYFKSLDLERIQSKLLKLKSATEVPLYLSQPTSPGWMGTLNRWNPFSDQNDNQRYNEQIELKNSIEGAIGQHYWDFRQLENMHALLSQPEKNNNADQALFVTRIKQLQESTQVLQTELALQLQQQNALPDWKTQIEKYFLQVRLLMQPLEKFADLPPPTPAVYTMVSDLQKAVDALEANENAKILAEHKEILEPLVKKIAQDEQLTASEQDQYQARIQEVESLKEKLNQEELKREEIKETLENAISILPGSENRNALEDLQIRMIVQDPKQKLARIQQDIKFIENKEGAFKQYAPGMLWTDWFGLGIDVLAQTKQHAEKTQLKTPIVEWLTDPDMLQLFSTLKDDFVYYFAPGEFDRTGKYTRIPFDAVKYSQWGLRSAISAMNQAITAVDATTRPWWTYYIELAADVLEFNIMKAFKDAKAFKKPGKVLSGREQFEFVLSALLKLKNDANGIAVSQHNCQQVLNWITSPMILECLLEGQKLANLIQEKKSYWNILVEGLAYEKKYQILKTASLVLEGIVAAQKLNIEKFLDEKTVNTIKKYLRFSKILFPILRVLRVVAQPVVSLYRMIRSLFIRDSKPTESLSSIDQKVEKAKPPASLTQNKKALIAKPVSKTPVLFQGPQPGAFKKAPNEPLVSQKIEIENKETKIQINNR